MTQSREPQVLLADTHYYIV